MRRLIAWLTVNDVTTGSSGLSPHPEIRPLDLGMPPDDAYDLALETARRMTGWRIVEESTHEGWFDAEARTPLLRFVDDIRVWIEERSGGGCRVQMRSRSRIGCGDFGANARRIQAFLQLVGESAGFGPRLPPPG
jgi:uncharacterized protein (DUF1499 family)